ncbi:MAG: hypothetical protein HC936_11170 [Leptolyngbyaceae cyanobacterium SU_3_3]|nr:hypothetical protein [Leptolyngbyaceae cyanobacterium SU_3_3]
MSSGIDDNDYWMLAEHYGIDDALVNPALDLLHIEADDDGYELHYRPEGERQLIIHCWTMPERVKEEIEEVLELFEGDSSEIEIRIREHMRNVRSVIGIEMGFSQLKDMGVVFAYEVARWFGQKYGGLIKDDDDNWSMIEGGVYVQL